MIPRNKTIVVPLLLSVLSLMLLAGCGSSSGPNPPTPPVPPIPGPLSAAKVNLIFVVSEDLAYQASGDVNPKTANLTNQGMQRSLLMATFLQQQVLGMKNVTGIYALTPMTHLQTTDNYPDMVALETVQQFSMLNQITLSSDPAGGTPYAGQNYPLNASYPSMHTPDGVATPPQLCPNCQGLDFSDQGGVNENLVTGIIKTKAAGFYVLSAPWETISTLLTNINKTEGYNLALPVSYSSPNYVYVISIAPSGTASLITYNSNLNPPSSYPVLPGPPLVGVACNAQPNFTVKVNGGEGGAVVPAGTNVDETLYIIRHAEAHPQAYWSDNNYVGAGQWRALDLPNG